MAADDLRPIPGYDGLYSVTSDGRIWSHPKPTGVSYHRGCWLKPWLVVGYPSVRLKTADGTRVTHYVHRIVAMVWVCNPSPTEWTHVNHKDGNRQNSASTNLEWCNRSMNLKHAYDTGARTATPRVIAHAKSMRARHLKKLAEQRASFAPSTSN